MTIDEYRKEVESIPFGKRVASALYVYRDGVTSFGPKIDTLLRQLIVSFDVSETHNVIKFRLDELKVSFLAYPAFLEDPHPSLRHAITIDLVTRKARQTDYETNSNPPILIPGLDICHL